ncbi:sugar ABC transporter permease [Acrocarpospora macrocephala]|uniref:Sugar ABC transporter permease n=1 Tax=Acrocarpospora macrocephala TaxID=150177 RepID=A0A5M3WMD8_9ACTN|nr:sugar ABC transporter permease [Acrocarpospora macrocephala]
MRVNVKRSPGDGTRRSMRREGLVPMLLMAPAAAGVTLFVLIPAVLSLVASLFRVPLTGGAWTFVGLDNFGRVLDDPAVRQAIGNTIVYSAITIVPSLVLGLGLALLTNAAGRGRPLVRTALLLPMTANLVAISVVYAWMFSHPGGFVNQVLAVVGVAPVNWLGEPGTALYVVALVGVWRTASLTMLVFVAGLATLPATIDEAARAEGIRGLRKLVLITLPMIRPTAVFAAVLAILNSVQVFDTVSVMTGGGPLGSTETVLTMTWRIGFGYFDLGTASALAFLLLVVLIAVGVLQRRTLSGWGR